LRQRKYALLRRFSIPADALPGSLALTHRRCGTPTCHCAHDAEGIPFGRSRIVVAGKTQGIPDEWVEQIRPLVEQGREFKDAVAEVLAANAQLPALRLQPSTPKRRKKP